MGTGHCHREIKVAYDYHPVPCPAYDQETGEKLATVDKPLREFCAECPHGPWDKRKEACPFHSRVRTPPKWTSLMTRGKGYDYQLGRTCSREGCDNPVTDKNTSGLCAVCHYLDPEYRRSISKGRRAAKEKRERKARGKE